MIGCRQDPAEKESPNVGRYHLAPTSAESLLSKEQQREIRSLETLGYLGGSEPIPSTVGVLAHDPQRSFPGANLYVSGHGPEAILMTMDGKMLHRWRFSFEDAFGDIAPEMRTATGATHWRRAHLFPNGDLLVIFEGIGIIKIDKQSKLLWRAQNGAHHDLSLTPEGYILVLTRKPRIRPDVHATKPILEDSVVLMSKDGKELKKLSLVDAWKSSPFVRYPVRQESGDIMHSNTVEWLDGRFATYDPAFKRGNLLISVRNPGWIVVVDLELGQFVWMRAPTIDVDKNLRWRGQHQTTMLDSGNMLFFDNRGAARGSRVIEFNPWSMKMIWMYQGTPPASFYSLTSGSAMRLPNGNTLVTESDSGRAFEVTADGDTVWRFASPHRAGKEMQYVASLFELVRIPLADLAWLDAPVPSPAK